MERPATYSQYIIFFANRILSLVSLCVVYNIAAEWSEKEQMMLSLDGIQYLVVELLMYISFGLLLGWFLCDNVSVTANRRVNIILTIIFAVLMMYPLTYFAMGYVGFPGISGLSLVLFKLAKYFQLAFGTFLFLILYKKLQERFLQQKL